MHNAKSNSITNFRRLVKYRSKRRRHSYTPADSKIQLKLFLTLFSEQRNAFFAPVSYKINETSYFYYDLDIRIKELRTVAARVYGLPM